MRNRKKRRQPLWSFVFCRPFKTRRRHVADLGPPVVTPPRPSRVVR